MGPPEGGFGDRRTDHRLRFLIAAGEQLSGDLGLDVAVRRIATIAANGFASAAIVDLVRDDGNTQRAALATRDRELAERLRAEEYALTASGVQQHPIALAVRRGSSSLLPVIAEGSGDPEWDRLVRETRTTSLIVVPVTDGERIYGALSLLRTGDAERPFARADLLVAEQLGNRAGIAFRQRLSHDRERGIARRLQEATMPRRLPSSAAYALDGLWVPGNREVSVGGDWYDAFELDDGRLAISVGDVLGSGLDAAIAMSQVRQAMQGAAFIDPDPASLLFAGHRTMALHEPDLFATAVAAIYDPTRRVLRYATAGHAGPFERRADGEVIEHSTTGLPLGLWHDRDRLVTEIRIPAGSLLLFFTDGLVEATRDLEEGYRLVRDALHRLPLVAARPAERIARDLLARGAHDDVCLLTLDTQSGAPATWAMPERPAAAETPPPAAEEAPAPPAAAPAAAARPARWREAFRDLVRATAADVAGGIADEVSRRLNGPPKPPAPPPA